MNKSVLIDKNLLNNIIELANKRKVAAANRLPNGVNFSDTKSISKALSPFAESEALEKAIDNLNLDQIRELSAIMYLGRDFLHRDNIDTNKIAEIISLHRKDAADCELKNVKQSIFEKAQFGEYLSEGLKLLSLISVY